MLQHRSPPTDRDSPFFFFTSKFFLFFAFSCFATRLRPPAYRAPVLPKIFDENSSTHGLCLQPKLQFREIICIPASSPRAPPLEAGTFFFSPRLFFSTPFRRSLKQVLPSLTITSPRAPALCPPFFVPGRPWPFDFSYTAFSSLPAPSN